MSTAPAHFTPAQRAAYERAHAEAKAMDDGGYTDADELAHARGLAAAERIAA